MLSNTAGCEKEHLSVGELGLVSRAKTSLCTGADTTAKIDRYMLHELYILDQAAREGYNSYTFSKGKWRLKADPSDS